MFAGTRSEELLYTRPTILDFGSRHTKMTMGSLIIDPLRLDHHMRRLTAIESPTQVRNKEIIRQLGRGYCQHDLTAEFHVCHDLIAISYFDLASSVSTVRSYHHLAQRIFTETLLSSGLSKQVGMVFEHTLVRVFRLVQDAQSGTTTLVVETSLRWGAWERHDE